MKEAGDALWLWRFASDLDDAGLLEALRPVASLRAVCRALEGNTVHVYADALPAGTPGSRLTCTRRLAGASADTAAPWHYVVETDVLPEHEAELNAWYDEEHLAGLAAVPGTVSASRFVREGGDGPRHVACYELASLDTFGSPPWLAVRATPWSARVRPTFRNTRRTMFRQLPLR